MESNETDNPNIQEQENAEIDATNSEKVGTKIVETANDVNNMEATPEDITMEEPATDKTSCDDNASKESTSNGPQISAIGAAATKVVIGQDQTMQDSDDDDDDLVAAAQQQSLKLNEQALLNQMESNFMSVKQERDSLRNTSKSQSQQIISLQTELSELLVKLHEQTTHATKQEQTSDKMQQHKVHAEEQTQLYREKVDRLVLELDQSQSENTKLTNLSQKLQSDIHHLTTSQEETASSAIPLRYETKRLQTQLDNVTSHSQWLETELSTRTQDLATQQTVHSNEMTQTQQALQKVNSKKQFLVTQKTQLETDKQELSQTVEELHSRLKDQKHIHSNDIASVQEELFAEQRVSQLLEEKSVRLQDQILQLTQTLDETKLLASKAVQEEQDRQSEFLQKAQSGMETQLLKVKELEDKLQQMTKEKKLAEKALQDKLAGEVRRRKLLHDKMSTMQDDAITDGTELSENNLPSIATPISLTELYARLAETEDELQESQTENARLQLYLQKICAEMEGSAPKIRQQQLDYRRALKESEDSQNRLEHALRDADSAHREAEDLAQELEGYSKEVKELRGENRDLASQVQILLTSRVEDESNSTKNDLLGFTNVSEMQEQNQSLINEHRRLNEQVTELQKKLDQSSLQESLDAAEEELNEMHEERTRQTTLVAGIVQQRDLYRALLAKTDQTLLLENEKTPQLLTNTAYESPRKKVSAQDVEEQTKLKAELFTANNTITTLEERVKRLDVHSSNLMESMDKLNQELSSANASIARSQAEATYHEEKCGRMEESMHGLKNQVMLTERRVSDVQALNVELQKAVAEARSDSSRWELELKQTTAKYRLMEAQWKTAQAAESRLLEETKSLQSELSRRGALLDSVQRIEASLSTKSAQEMKVLEEEIHNLRDSAKVMETKTTSALEAANDKISSLEITITNLQKQKEQAMTLSVNAKDLSLGYQKQVKFLETKSNQLEKELEEKNQSLKDLAPKAPLTVDGNKKKIDELTAELQRVQTELKVVQERAVTYQGIAKKTEADLADLTKVTDQFKKEKMEELESIKSDLVLAKTDGNAKHLALVDLAKDLENQRTEQKGNESKLQKKIITLETQVGNFTKDLESSKEQLSTLKTEVDFHRDTALTEQKNYERELDLHSTARTELRATRSNLDVEQSRRESAEGDLKSLKFEQEEQIKVWKDDKMKMEQTIQEMEERLKNAREQNNLLHNQMNELTTSVEKIQASRIENAVREEEEIGLLSSKSEESEISKLEKTISELRGIIRYMKSEREIVDAQLDTVRRAVERERATSAVAKRNLDEARAELELLQKRSNGGVLIDPSIEANKENEHILKKSDEQMTLLRESNALLREESERLRAKLESTQSSLNDMKKTFEPSQLKIRQLEVDIAASSSEKASLEKEVDAWKNRMQNFVSKFQMIDPEEHEKSLKLTESLKKELENLKSLKEKSDQASTNAKAIVSRLNREISQQKTLNKEVNAKLSKTVVEKDSALKAKASVGATMKKEQGELKKNVEELENELKALKPERDALKTRVENLTKMLKQYKTKMINLNKAQHASMVKEKEMQKTLEKEREALKEKTAALDKASSKEAPKQMRKVPTKPKKPMSSGKTVDDDKATPDPTKNEEVTEEDSSSNVPTLEKQDAISKPTVEVPEGGFKFAATPLIIPTPEDPQNPHGESELKEHLDATPSSAKATQGSTGPVTKKPKLTKIGKASESERIIKKSEELEVTVISKNESSVSSTADEAKQNLVKSVGAKKSKIIKLGQSSTTDIKSAGKNASRAASESKVDTEMKQSTPSKIPAVPDMSSLKAKLMERKRKLNTMLAAEKSKKKILLEGGKEESTSNAASESEPSQKPVLASSSSTDSKVETKASAPSPATPLTVSLPGKKSVFGSSSQSNPVAAIQSSEKSVFGTFTSTSEKNEASKAIPAAQPSQKSIFGTSSTTVGKPETSKGLPELKPSQESKTSFGFGSTTTPTAPFGSSTATSTFGNPFAKSTAEPPKLSAGGTFLNLKPPGSSATSPNLTFGSSTSITLPLPSKSAATAPKMSFGIFGQTNAPSTAAAFGGTTGSSSLFGKTTKKGSAEDIGQVQTPKQPHTEVKNIDENESKEN